MKTRQAYCDLIIREKGPADWPALTIEIESSYDEEFKEAIKELPRGARVWDEACERWRVHPNFLLNAEELARKYFSRARLLVGDQITDLHSGQTYQQPRMF